jgi:hypothetical protein
MESSIELMLTPPSEDAKTLFIGGLPVVVLQVKTFNFAVS